jgi:hypothetical protein
MEFYEEALSLVFDLTSKKISADLWKVLEMIYQVRCYKFPLISCALIEVFFCFRFSKKTPLTTLPI